MVDNVSFDNSIDENVKSLLWSKCSLLYLFHYPIIT